MHKLRVFALRVNIPEKPLLSRKNEKQDRQLGQLWLHWRGKLRPSEINSKTNKNIFLVLSFILLIFLGLMLYWIDYLIRPRLYEIHPMFPKYIALFFIFIWMAVFFSYTFLVLSICMGRNSIAKHLPDSLPIKFLVPSIFKLGRLVGKSGDQIANSFIHVHNCWIHLRVKRTKAAKILILLPRCLHFRLRNQISSISQIRHITVFTVSGGEMARRIVEEKNPETIIGVACERDLLSGIKDLYRHVQIIGIPNLRPEGPCKNTHIDIHELEKAILAVLKP